MLIFHHHAFDTYKQPTDDNDGVGGYEAGHSNQRLPQIMSFIVFFDAAIATSIL